MQPLNFVKNAVGKSGNLCHFLIKNNHLHAFNGTFAACHDLGTDFATPFPDCQPEAVSLSKALKKVNPKNTKITLGKDILMLKSGKFTAKIKCSKANFPDLSPCENANSIDGEAFVSALSVIKPFICTDEGRPQFCSARFEGKSVFATNNVILIEHICGSFFDSVVYIPRFAVSEILRIKEFPIAIAHDQFGLTLYYRNGWIKTQLIVLEWPNISGMLPNAESECKEIDPELFEAAKFVSEDDSPDLIFDMTGVKCGDFHYELPGYQYAVFEKSMFLSLEKIALELQINSNGKPAIFFGENLRGVMASKKQ